MKKRQKNCVWVREVCVSVRCGKRKNLPRGVDTVGKDF